MSASLTHGVENDSRSSESNARILDGNAHISLHGVRSAHATVGWIHKHGDESQTMSPVLLDRDGHFRHLHQRHGARLHSRTACSAHNAHWQVVLERVLESASHFL